MRDTVSIVKRFGFDQYKQTKNWQYETHVLCTANEKKKWTGEKEKREPKIECKNVTNNHLHNQLILPLQIHSIAFHCSEYETKDIPKKSGNETLQKGAH